MKARHSGVTRYAIYLVTALAMTVSACGMMGKEAKVEAAAEQAKPLSDGEIVAVVQTLNRGEITQARLAASRARDADVRAVADHIIDDHQRLERQVANLDIAPQPSELSRSLEQLAKETQAQLQEKSGAEFDQAYLKAQEQMHKLAVDTVENQLLPAASDPQLRQVLSEGLIPLQKHLAQSRLAQSMISEPKRG